MAHYSEQCTGCNKPLKTWEYKICETCRTKFDPEGFRKSMQEHSENYDRYMANQAARSQSQPSTNKTADARAVQPATVASSEYDYEHQYD